MANFKHTPRVHSTTSSRQPLEAASQRDRFRESACSHAVRARSRNIRRVRKRDTCAAAPSAVQPRDMPCSLHPMASRWGRRVSNVHTWTLLPPWKEVWMIGAAMKIREAGHRAQGTGGSTKANLAAPSEPAHCAAPNPARLPTPDACQDNLRLAPRSRFVHGTFFGHARIKQQTHGGECPRPLPQATSAWHSGAWQSCSQGKPAEGEHDGLEVQLAYR
jgi:hypothetical protein